MDKPKKTAKQIVEVLEDKKGILFNIIDKNATEEYLLKRNNYLRTASYRKNYTKHQSGDNKGKYINLEFAYLIELAKLDMYLREVLLSMCIDIEHSLKVMMLAEVENNLEEDGYNIVDEFLDENPQIIKSLEVKSDAIFTGELIDKYFKLCTVIDFGFIKSYSTKILAKDCPVWVILELMSFGDTIKFYEFYCKKYINHSMVKIGNNIFNSIKSLRNACAHNNCLLNSLNPCKSTSPPAVISQFLTTMNTIGKEERINKLATRPLLEFTCLIYVYDKVVSPDVKKYKLMELKKIVCERFDKNMNLFEDNKRVLTSLKFMQKIILNLVDESQ